MNRNGKIARLPGDIRDELNERLNNAEEGDSLLAWLNAQPEVQKILQVNFEAAPISKQNLSEWRLGGFREWQLRCEWIEQASEFQGDSLNLDEKLEVDALPGELAGALAIRYAALINTWDGEPNPEFEEKLRLLRRMLQDIALLQKTMQRAAKEKRDVEKIEKEEEREHQTDLVEMHMKEDIMAHMYGGGEAGRIMAKMMTKAHFGVLTQADFTEAAAKARKIKAEREAQSKPVKPSQTKAKSQSPREDKEPALSK